jgi:hypothetical protein
LTTRHRSMVFARRPSSKKTEGLRRASTPRGMQTVGRSISLERSRTARRAAEGLLVSDSDFSIGSRSDCEGSRRGVEILPSGSTNLIGSSPHGGSRRAHWAWSLVTLAA